MEEQLTKEKEKQMEGVMLEHYQDKLPFLRAQEEYWRLMASVEESQVKYHVFREQFIKFKLAQKEAQEKGGSNEPGKA